MPFPLIPFLAGAAAGALATYLLTNRSETEESSIEKGLAEPTEDKLDPNPPSDEDQQPDRAISASSDAEQPSRDSRHSG